MKKFLFIFLAISSLSAFADQRILGLHCGTRGTLLGTLASDLLIPDYFPPETFLLQLVLAPFLDLSECEEIGSAHLGQSCEIHDQCYGTLGAEKDVCDDDVLLGWVASCEQTYSASPYCSDTCTTAVGIMYAALLYDDGILCPSCIAFEIAQSRAQERAE